MIAGYFPAEKDPELRKSDVVGVTGDTANGNILAVEERHDDRLIASDNELLASLIRRKHSVMLEDNCDFMGDGRKSGGEVC